jgi:hypothetical protein
VLVSATGDLIDPVDGTSFGHIPAPEKRGKGGWSWGQGFAAATGNRLFGRFWKGSLQAFDFSLDDGGRPVVQQDPIILPSEVGSHPFAVSDRVVAAAKTLYDPATGKTLCEQTFSEYLPGTRNVIAGEYLMQPVVTIDGKNPKAGRNPSYEQWCTSGLLGLTTYVHDLRGDRINQPPEIAKNVIVARGYTPDISHKHFPEFGRDPALRRFASYRHGHGNYHGIGLCWSICVGGITAKGAHLYAHSPAHLYCIGK